MTCRITSPSFIRKGWLTGSVMKSFMPSRRAFSTETLPSSLPGDAALLGAQLGARHAVDQLEPRDVTECINDFAALVGRTQHHHPPQTRNLAPAQVLPNQDPAQGMSDEMNGDAISTPRQP